MGTYQTFTTMYPPTPTPSPACDTHRNTLRPTIQGRWIGSCQTFPATQSAPVCVAHTVHTFIPALKSTRTVIKHSRLHRNTPGVWHTLYTPLYQLWSVEGQYSYQTFPATQSTPRCVVHTVHTFISALKCRGTVIKHSLLHKAPTFMSTMTGRKKDSSIIKHSMKHKAPLCIWLALYTAPCQPDGQKCNTEHAFKTFS